MVEHARPSQRVGPLLRVAADEEQAGVVLVRPKFEARRILERQQVGVGLAAAEEDAIGPLERAQLGQRRVHRGRRRAALDEQRRLDALGELHGSVERATGRQRTLGSRFSSARFDRAFLGLTTRCIVGAGERRDEIWWSSASSECGAPARSQYVRAVLWRSTRAQINRGRHRLRCCFARCSSSALCTRRRSCGSIAARAGRSRSTPISRVTRAASARLRRRSRASPAQHGAVQWRDDAAAVRGALDRTLDDAHARQAMVSATA